MVTQDNNSTTLNLVGEVIFISYSEAYFVIESFEKEKKIFVNEETRYANYKGAVAGKPVINNGSKGFSQLSVASQVNVGQFTDSDNKTVAKLVLIY